MSLRMKRLVVLAILLAACGDNIKGAAIDAAVDAAPIDMAIDADVDAMVDAMPTPAEQIAAVRAATDTPDGQTIALPITDATVTYLKPLIAGSSPSNDSASFTVQVGATGPALLVAVDPASLTLTPALAVGDVISFTVTVKDSAGSSPRATMISNVTRSATGTSVASLVQDITATTGIADMIADFDSELVDVTAATIAQVWGPSGSAFSRARITTTGQPTIDDDFQLRLPTTFKDSLEASADLEVGCIVAIHRTPVNRFGAQFQVSAFNTTDLTITSCPTPTVAAATATTATTVTVRFSRNIDMATVMANGSQFTIADDATTPNPLVVTAAALTAPDTVTLTTAVQTSATNYTVTVANTVEDVLGAAIGAPLTANFTGFVVPIPTVMMAAATNATTVNVTFTRNIDMATVTADGSQFAIVDDATVPNTLAVSAASVSGMVVTLTTAAQTSGTMYTVTVLPTVEDTDGTPVGAPLSASFLGFTPAAAVDHLVINEVDYDQTGTDANTFIEIYNPTNAAIALADFAVVYLNGGATGGATASSYGTRVMLSTAGTELVAGGYLLIRNSTVAANGAMTIDVAGDFLQNGADGLALINATTNTLVDALHYAHAADGVGAGITMATIAGFASTVSLVEGTVFATADTPTGSLGRFPNGADTNNASVDWSLRATPSPGMAN
jgi:hypothetical protein